MQISSLSEWFCAVINTIPYIYIYIENNLNMKLFQNLV